MANTKTKTSESSLSRPPIVAVLGHVDHGKTSLLDTIRKTHVTEREAGGITQHIGAYQITFTPKDSKSMQAITFIDTPGHEAFAKMRSRGSSAADIVILVVAATEGVKPQTEESIAHIKQANIPYIVALNKMDLPEANIDRALQQLAKAGVLVEKFGGDVVVVPVSAKIGTGISQLLDTILLVAEMKGITADAAAKLEAVVIESHLDKRRGALAALIVKNGTLKIGQTIYVEGNEARVRSLTDSQGINITQAVPGMPVEVMGWKSVPRVGAVVESEKGVAPEAAAARFLPKEFSLPPLETTKKLRLILKTDVGGTLEAIKENLATHVEIIQADTGEITESDVLLARSTGSIIIGFHVKAASRVLDLARAEKVKIKTYEIIYELLDEIREVSEFMNKPEALEEILGEARIMAEFQSNDIRVAGCKVEKGKMSLGDSIRLMRATKEIGQTKIKSLRKGKEAAQKVEAGSECGIVLDKQLDFRLGDHIIAYKVKELL